MKAFFGVACLLSYAAAQQTTTNDCTMEDDAVFNGTCKDLYYKLCRNYNIVPAGSCNFKTYGSINVNWFASQITASVWNMIPGTFTVDPESGEVTYEGQPTDSSAAAPATSSRLRST